MPLPVELNFPGVDSSDVRGLGHKAAQSPGFLVDDRQQLVALCRIGHAGGEERRGRGFNGRQWSFEFVGETIEQRGLELLALPRGLRARGNLAAAGILEADRNET